MEQSVIDTFRFWANVQECCLFFLCCCCCFNSAVLKWVPHSARLSQPKLEPTVRWPHCFTDVPVSRHFDILVHTDQEGEENLVCLVPRSKSVIFFVYFWNLFFYFWSSFFGQDVKLQAYSGKILLKRKKVWKVSVHLWNAGIVMPLEGRWLKMEI